MAFNPNAKTIAQCLEILKEANRKAGFDPKVGITTSRDSAAKLAVEALRVTNIPDGFKKFQLPVHMGGQSMMYLSIGTPDTVVPEHSHNEGDGFRFIVSGSILHKDQELTGGDWMYIPKGKKYSFKVGPHGVTMFYCYECCCA